MIPDNIVDLANFNSLAPHSTSDFDDSFSLAVMNSKDFEYLYNTHWKKVFGIVYHYTEDREISAELTQELFAVIWEKRCSLKIHRNISSYLFRAAKLEAFDYLRTIARQKQLLENFSKSIYQSDNSTENSILHNELRARMSALVDQLPPRCQEVYYLSQNEGLNKGAIAGRLSISEKTVEYHLYKAMSFLRDSLRLDNNLG